MEHDHDFISAPWGPFGRDLTLGVVSLASKLVMQLLNTTHIINHDAYLDLIYNRPSGLGLLTICNHTRQVTAAVYSGNGLQLACVQFDRSVFQFIELLQYCTLTLQHV